MGWTANATVQEVTATGVSLTADSSAITSDGDDQVVGVKVEIVTPTQSHLKVGDVVQITANC